MRPAAESRATDSDSELERLSVRLGVSLGVTGTGGLGPHWPSGYYTETLSASHGVTTFMGMVT